MMMFHGICSSLKRILFHKPLFLVISQCFEFELVSDFGVWLKLVCWMSLNDAVCFTYHKLMKFCWDSLLRGCILGFVWTLDDFMKLQKNWDFVILISSFLLNLICSLLHVHFFKAFIIFQESYLRSYHLTSLSFSSPFLAITMAFHFIFILFHIQDNLLPLQLFFSKVQPKMFLNCKLTFAFGI